MEDEERDRLVELANAVYHAIGRIEGEFTTGMYGNKFPGLNEMHEKVLYNLKSYDTLLESILS